LGGKNKNLGGLFIIYIYNIYIYIMDIVFILRIEA
jgi:hypothetical protein